MAVCAECKDVFTSKFPPIQTEIENYSILLRPGTMPLMIKDFCWRQSEEIVIIRVPLKNVHLKNVDLFTTSNYIKAHYSPFLFEVFLWGEVDEKESKCTVSDDELVFELKKVVPKLWNNLEANMTKREAYKMRLDIIATAQEREAANKEAKLERNAELQRLAVRQQILLDTKERKVIDELKNQEKIKAMKELEDWKVENKSLKGIDYHCSEVIQNNNHVKRIGNAARNLSNDYYNEPMPLMRKCGKISVKFTPRVFPTPSRESQIAQEEEWLKKQYEARKNIGFVVEDLKPEEQDPDWLKEKGDEFFQVGNYLGAISAYSHAIKMGCKLPALFSNRAAAHLALGNFWKTIEDCSAALELHVPHVPLNADARARCYARRGTALCKLGRLSEGLGELQSAFDLCPGDKSLEADITKIKNKLKEGQENCSDEDY